MEARLKGVVLLATLLALGASYRTANFIVTAPTSDMARQIGDTAERCRRELAVEWLGKPMPNWSRPCPITAEIGKQLGAGGATSFVFDRGEVFSWEMSIQGPLDRVLDSVVPHEVTHTIFASHFRQPLPRWADEGGCSTVEHSSERYKQQQMLIQFLQTGRGIPFNQMFAMKEYPRDILPLYAQGHSLASYFLAQGGKRKYVEFIGAGLESGNWAQTVERFYGYASLGELQTQWLTWVRAGSPAFDAPQRPGMPAGGEVQLAAHGSAPNQTPAINQAPAMNQFAAGQAAPPQAIPADDKPVYRGQSPDEPGRVSEPVLIGPLVRLDSLPGANQFARGENNPSPPAPGPATDQSHVPQPNHLATAPAVPSLASDGWRGASEQHRAAVAGEGFSPPGSPGYGNPNYGNPAANSVGSENAGSENAGPPRQVLLEWSRSEATPAGHAAPNSVAPGSFSHHGAAHNSAAQQSVAPSSAAPNNASRPSVYDARGPIGDSIWR